MWYNEIEISRYESVQLKDIFDILCVNLNADEKYRFSQELLNSLGKANLLEPFDYQLDV